VGVSYFILYFGWGWDRIGRAGGVYAWWDSIYRFFFSFSSFCSVACALFIQDGRGQESLNIMINKRGWGFCFVMLVHPYGICLA